MYFSSYVQLQPMVNIANPYRLAMKGNAQMWTMHLNYLWAFDGTIILRFGAYNKLSFSLLVLCVRNTTACAVQAPLSCVGTGLKRS